MSRTLVVTNDFPTRRGGIESFVLALCERMDPASVVVYTATMPGDTAYDATLPFPVFRDPRGTLLPTPAVARRVGEVLRAEGCDRVLFGASMPLGLLAPGLRRAGALRLVGLTHGHEVWWARAPVARRLLRKVGDGCDVLTYVSEWCRERIAATLSPEAAGRMRRLSPGVDVARFRPGSGGEAVRARLGIHPDAPVVVCTARMVRRKGQDLLVRAWPQVRAAVPDAVLLLVGDGPDRRRIERLVAAQSLGDSVLLTGSVPWAEMPAHTDAGDVFAMPCRTRRGGLEPEAFGIVAMEAAACGLPVVIGRSGGTPETVEEGVTGYVVDPTSVAEVTGRLVALLSDPERAQAMGAAGRVRTQADGGWDRAAASLMELLA